MQLLAMAMARWVLPVPVPPTSTALRCWAMKPPPARSCTSVSLIGVFWNWKSSRSSAPGVPIGCRSPENGVLIPRRNTHNRRLCTSCRGDACAAALERVQDCPNLHMRPDATARRADIALVEPCGNCVVAGRAAMHKPLPRAAAREKGAGQWRSVPPYASPRIGDHVGWSVQRRQCVIEELAISWQYLCASIQERSWCDDYTRPGASNRSELLG